MRAWLGILSGLLLLVYPGLVYYGLLHWQTRTLALSLLPILALRGLLGLNGAQRAQVRAVAHVPLLAALLLVAAALFDEPRFMLAMPVLMSALMLASFAASLRGVPLVERLARLRDPELPPEAVAYCRALTRAWCVFFVLNGGTALLLALFAPLAAWALFTGILSYVAMGVFAGVELVYRKYRFRRYGAGLADRVFAALFPARGKPS
jgi:uncharacterized membrane protein